MYQKTVGEIIQWLSQELIPGREFYGVAFGEKGGAIKLIGPFFVVNRQGETVSFVDSEETWGYPRYIKTTISDLVMSFDKIVPIRERHKGSSLPISYIEIRLSNRQRQ